MYKDRKSTANALNNSLPFLTKICQILEKEKQLPSSGIKHHSELKEFLYRNYLSNGFLSDMLWWSQALGLTQKEPKSRLYTVTTEGRSIAKHGWSKELRKFAFNHLKAFHRLNDTLNLNLNKKPLHFGGVFFYLRIRVFTP